MPISYSVDAVEGLVSIRWEGRITAAILDEHWRKLVGDPEVLACGASLGDLRQAELCFTGPELQELIRQHLVPVLASRKWITAILVDTKVQFGVGRQYSALTALTSNSNLFGDESEALAWLRTQRA